MLGIGQEDVTGTFFFASRRRHTRLKCDWSSDVCSSDLTKLEGLVAKIDEAISSGNGNGADGRRSRLEKARETIQDTIWRYKKGPTGRGRSTMGMVNS